MRIAQVSAHTSPLAPLGGRETGGMNVYVLELSRELARLGIEVDIFTRLDGPLPMVEQIAPGLRLVRLRAGPAEPIEKETIAGHLEEFAAGLLAFAAQEPRPYDLVHSHYWQSGLAASALSHAAHIPHVAMFHTLGEVKNRARISEEEPGERIRREREIAAEAAGILTASEHEGLLLRRYYGARAESIHRVPCGIDTELFRPRDRAVARATLGLPADAPVILWVGRLEKLKGVDILVEAMGQLAERDFTLLIVGGDQRAEGLRADLEEQANAAGIARNLRFEGAVAHDELPEYYSAADICVVPSYYESFGLVAVEAMACGTPVVASRVGGLVSTVEDGVTGYLIPWRCPEPFAEKIEVLLGNPELRANFGRAARRSVERFAWPRVGVQVAAFYNHVLQEHWENAKPGPRFGSEVYEAAVLAGRAGGL